MALCCEQELTETLSPSSEDSSSSSGWHGGYDPLVHDEKWALPEGKASPGWMSWRIFGPGMLVCLADTDAGCLIVAAQSGARWGYGLLLLQIVLIPILFLAQELTVRLGVYTKQGHTACIRKHYGPVWAWFACSLLVLECIGAMMSEMSGIASVGELWGMSRNTATVLSAVVIVATVVAGSYRQVEAIGVTCGLFELTFVLTMFLIRDPPMEVLEGTFTFSTDPEYVKLVSANIGAVIMPWMIYFQQSAVVARRLETKADLKEERSQTLVGSILTQLVMIGALMTMAAAKAKAENLEDVKDIVAAMAPALGELPAAVLVSFGFVGGSLCAAFVVSLAAAWAVCEAQGSNDHFSLDMPPTQAPFFYGVFLGTILVGMVALFAGVSVVQLNVLVELMDGILMPFAVGFLYLLATGPALPPEARVTGAHKVGLAIIFSTCTVLSLACAGWGLFGG